MRHPVRLLAVLACALAACQAAPKPLSPADETAIRATSDAFTAAANAGNVDGLSALYTSDAAIHPDLMPAAVGAEAIRKLWTDMTAAVRVTIAPTITQVKGAGDMAWMSGTYHVAYAMKDSTLAAPPAEDGKFLEVLMRQGDGSWKIVADSWNANAPPAAPAPPPPARRH